MLYMVFVLVRIIVQHANDVSEAKAEPLYPEQVKQKKKKN